MFSVILKLVVSRGQAGGLLINSDKINNAIVILNEWVGGCSFS